MKILIAPSFCLLLANCGTLPEPLRDDQNGMKLARITNKAYADPLTDEDVHQVLFATYSRSRDPLMGGEDLEMIQGNLMLLRERLGDEKFAAALRREHAAVIAAIAWHLGSESRSTKFPLSSAAVEQAPKRTFELDTSYAQQ